MATALLGMGSNLGDRAAALSRAVELLRDHAGVESVTVSRWHQTPPIGGPTGQGTFLNAAARIETSLSPEQLLATLHEIEAQLGRTREVRWDQRTLDLDLLIYDDTILQTPELQIPHPRMAFRRFVLEPAAQVAAEMIHPVLCRSVESLLTHLEQAVPYAAIAGGNFKSRFELQNIVPQHLHAQFVGSAVGSRFDSSNLNRTSLDVGQGLEFLDLRSQEIKAETWPDREKWRISNFWLGELCLALKDDVPETDRTTIADAWWKAQRTAMPAKLVILLDPEQQLTPAMVAERWRRLTSQPMTPFLLLQSQNLAMDVIESAAAMAAML